jgi:hypothetical protein
MPIVPGCLGPVLDVCNGAIIRCPGRQQRRRGGSGSTQATQFDVRHHAALCPTGTPLRLLYATPTMEQAACSSFGYCRCVLVEQCHGAHRAALALELAQVT